ncbi:MAG: cobyrinate a,c-diamide synthase [Bacteroidales bacterium]
MVQKTQLLIGATASGSGKTTFTLGLLRCLRNRGIIVQPFKCGPDYIDTKFHTMAVGDKNGETESVNLDSYLSSTQHIKEIYSKYGANADACIVEGVMGLFDGYNKMDGSSAQIAEMLNIPVLLIINAKACAYSVAPIIYGYKNFYRGINIAGVVFNMVGSESHYQLLKQACKDVGITALGYIPNCKEIEIPSRHLGLTLDEKFRFNAFTQRIANILELHVDIDKILNIFKSNFCICNNISSPKLETTASLSPLIAVAKDEAFNFIYRENIEQLKKVGNIIFFSPINDTQIPIGANFVYLPGGYPELFIKKIAANISMKESIKKHVEGGGKLLAECGGMMYLCNSIIGIDGKEYSMCNVLPLQVTMEEMKLHIGYRKFTYNEIEVRGHEFHYSKIRENKIELCSVAQLYTALGKKIDTPLYKYKNAIAGYTHLYWGEFNIMNLY